MRKFAVAFLVLKIFFLSLLPAQQKPHTAAPAADRTISGTVMSMSTGQPLADAEVSLTDSKGGAFRLDTFTHADGRFAFSQLYEGKFSLHAEHRGYITSGFNEHEGYFTGIVTGDGLVSTDLKFLLAPQASISGTVTDETGDPVVQASVRLFKMEDRSGREKLVPSGVTNTDDLGNYEFSQLAAGTYFLAVTATPWYATRAQPSMGGLREGVSGGSGTASTRSPLDVVFAPTYYSQTTDSDTATPIPVKPADRIPINVTLQAQSAVHITMKVPTPKPNEQQVIQAMPQLRTKIFGNMEDTQQGTTLSSTDDGTSGSGMATLEISGVASGLYEVDMQKGRGGPMGVATIDASSGSTSGSVMFDPAALETQADIDGKVAMDDGSALPAHMALSLVPDEGEAKVGGLNAAGAFHISNVHAGDYRVQILGPLGEYAVKQLAATGGTVDGSLVKVGNSPVMLAAVAAESITTVHGFAKLDAKPVAGAMMVLIPDDGNREAFRRDQSDSDGSFLLRQVMPGHYTLVAIEDGWSLEWARPEVMQRFLAKGVKVAIMLHGKNLNLKDPVVVQPR